MNDSKMQDVLKFMYIRTGDEDEDNVRPEEVMELWTPPETHQVGSTVQREDKTNHKQLALERSHRL